MDEPLPFKGEPCEHVDSWGQCKMPGRMATSMLRGKDRPFTVYCKEHAMLAIIAGLKPVPLPDPEADERGIGIMQEAQHGS